VGNEKERKIGHGTEIPNPLRLDPVSKKIGSVEMEKAILALIFSATHGLQMDMLTS
jgi:hypothetical protein